MVAKHPLSLPGIYRITRISDGKVYIGQARKCSQRWTMHRHSLKNGKHRNGPLQEAWDASAPSDWTWEIVCQPLGAHDPETMTFLEVEVLRNYPDNFNLMVPIQAYLGAGDSTRAKLSAQRLELWSDPEYKERLKASHAKLRDDPDYKARHGAAMQAFYDTEESKAVRREGGKKASAAWTERTEMREAESERRKKLWADPEHRSKQDAARKASWADPASREKRMSGLKGSWARLTPEEHAERVAKASAHTSDPAFKAKLSAAIKAGWEKRRARAAAGLPPKARRPRPKTERVRKPIEDIDAWWKAREGGGD